MKIQENKPLIDEDGEVRELTEQDLAKFKPIAEVMPKEFLDMVFKHQGKMEQLGLMKPRSRGKQKAPTKQSVTIRLS